MSRCLNLLSILIALTCFSSLYKCSSNSNSLRQTSTTESQDYSSSNNNSSNFHLAKDLIDSITGTCEPLRCAASCCTYDGMCPLDASACYFHTCVDSLCDSNSNCFRGICQQQDAGNRVYRVVGFVLSISVVIFILLCEKSLVELSNLHGLHLKRNNILNKRQTPEDSITGLGALAATASQLKKAQLPPHQDLLFLDVEDDAIREIPSKHGKRNTAALQNQEQHEGQVQFAFAESKPKKIHAKNQSAQVKSSQREPHDYPPFFPQKLPSTNQLINIHPPLSNSP